jgi:hypothetical protein
MRTATVHELKQELTNIPPPQLAELCLRLVKFKKENKELLTFLLFDAQDIQHYTASVKKEIDEQFASINQSNLYFAKKTIRKILRITNKHIRYTGSKEVEAELLIYFCATLNQSGIAFRKSAALANLYANQVKKITAAIQTMHEDLQYDYVKGLDQLIAVDGR